VPVTEISPESDCPHGRGDLAGLSHLMGIPRPLPSVPRNNDRYGAPFQRTIQVTLPPSRGADHRFGEPVARPAGSQTGGENVAHPAPDLCWLQGNAPGDPPVRRPDRHFGKRCHQRPGRRRHSPLARKRSWCTAWITGTGGVHTNPPSPHLASPARTTLGGGDDAGLLDAEPPSSGSPAQTARTVVEHQRTGQRLGQGSTGPGGITGTNSSMNASRAGR